MSEPSPELVRAKTASCLAHCVLSLSNITDSLLELAEDLEKLAEHIKLDLAGES